MTRAAALLLLLAAACPSKRTPPAADASVSAGDTAIVAADLQLTPRGQDEWTLIPTGRSAVTIRRAAQDVRAVDATGEVLAVFRGDELRDANDDLVARIAVHKNEPTFSLTDPAGEPIATLRRGDAAAILAVTRLSPEQRAILFVAFRQ